MSAVEHAKKRADRGNRAGTDSPRARRLAVLSAAALVLSGFAGITMASAETIAVGEGSFTTDTVGPIPEGCAPLATDARAFIEDTAPAGAVPTNDWWSSLVFKKFNCVGSEPLHAHPLSYLPEATGLGVSYTTTPTFTPPNNAYPHLAEFHYPYSRDLFVSVEGLNAPVVKAADWSDWTVTPSWNDGTRTMKATIGHGLPFTWFDVTGGDAVITGVAPFEVWLNDGARIGFRSGGADYVAFAPTGAAWTVAGSTLTNGLDGKGYFSLAVLPTSSSDGIAARSAIADAYTPYAHAKVVDTRADYSYDEATSMVETVYSVTTQAVEGTNTGTVLSLYPHHSAFLDGVTGDGPSAGAALSQAYVSPRGAMQTRVGATSFTTATPYTGVLPEVPAVATGDGDERVRLSALLDRVRSNLMTIDPDQNDTYWTGKALGRAARIVEIADQLDRTAVRDEALAEIKAVLTDWFTASPGETEQLFAYNANWGTLVGFPGSYGSDTEINDHHFHYGYFVVAAATLARFDPDWAAGTAFGGMVDELIADANGFDRSDTRYPYLRDFDIYAGHDWASGHGAFWAGNNQESSSEGQNFANGLIQWGEATGDIATRDAGIYLYATQTAAIQQYWFDESGAMPEEFGHNVVGMVWGDGGTYTTWFSALPEMIQGINTLPITGGHLYLGLRPDNVVENYDHMEAMVGGPPTVWHDILWSYLALGDGPRALAYLDNDREYPEEEGESRAHTYHWIANLAALGNLDPSIHADSPIAAVFDKDGARTYVASNITQDPITVTFSNGTVLDVPVGRTVTSGAHVWSGGGAPSGTEDPDAPPPPPVDPTTTFYLGADGSLLAEPGSVATRTVPAAPSPGVTFIAENLNGTFQGARTVFDIGVDTTGVGNATQVRVSYDLTGDGTFDRIETYNYFATDPVPGFERYTQEMGLQSTEGQLGDLVDGTMKVEIWNVFGPADSMVDLQGSVVKAPWSNLHGTDPEPTPTPTATPTATSSPTVDPTSSPTVTSSPTATSSPAPTTTTPGDTDDGALPDTGAGIAGLGALAAGLVLAGLWLMRRRELSA